MINIENITALDREVLLEIVENYILNGCDIIDDILDDSFKDVRGKNKHIDLLKRIVITYHLYFNLKGFKT